MYIHSYQINNVLDVYRKQLSRTTASSANPDRPAKSQLSTDQVKLSAESQRRSIIDKVSAEIVDRMARNGPTMQLDDSIYTGMTATIEMPPNLPVEEKAQFTYSVIDENNNKRINTISVNGFRPSFGEENTQSIEAEP